MEFPGLPGGLRPITRPFVGRRVCAFALLAPLWLLAGPAPAARIGLVPLMDDGAAGRTTVLSGANFEPATTYTVLIGGFPVVPATVTSSAAGAIAPTVLALPSLPGGYQDVTLTSAARTRVFTAAYQVWRNVCLTPETGDGRPGQTWQSNAAIPTGGWSGSVLILRGTGFAANATVAANSITVGGAVATHPAIPVTADGRLPATTLYVAAGLANGFQSLVVTDTLPTTFTNAYEVRRSLGMYPARGTGAVGTTVLVDGWGFTDGTMALNSIQIGGFATTHGTVTVTNGAFSVVVTIATALANGQYSVATSQQTFTNAYQVVGAATTQMALDPLTPIGPANEAFLVAGMGNWIAGVSAANTSLLRVPGADIAMTHAAFTVANGRFPLFWMVASRAVESNATGMGVNNPTAGLVNTNCMMTQRSLSVCPVMSDGVPGFTATIEGYGFRQNRIVANNTITVGGQPTTSFSVTVTAYGLLGPMTVTDGALPNGDLSMVITDNVATTFANAIHVARTIGLSFVDGPGSAGDVTSLTGWGFAPGTIAANSITFNATPVTHAAITAAANGSFAASALTLPLLAAGPYNLTAQGTFGQPYRVTNPAIETSKFASTTYVSSGGTLTYSFSFTNTQGVGDPRALSLVLFDTVPAGMSYLAGSSTLTPAGTIDWFHSGCACFTGVDSGGDVTKVRWTLANPLAVASSGYASFKVTVQ